MTYNVFGCTLNLAQSQSVDIVFIHLPNGAPRTASPTPNPTLPSPVALGHYRERVSGKLWVFETDIATHYTAMSMWYVELD